MINKLPTVGILSFHGDVVEHIQATRNASQKLRLQIKIIPVKTKLDFLHLDALIIPGGESTTIQKLCEREGIWEKIKKINYMFGTCGGTILLAKKVLNKAEGQKSLALMDIEVDRNAYGRQTHSFEANIDSALGKLNAIFIRAPKIKSIGAGVKILAKNNGEIIACEEKIGNKYYLATTFHPELTTTSFHEYFLKNVLKFYDWPHRLAA